MLYSKRQLARERTRALLGATVVMPELSMRAFRERLVLSDAPPQGLHKFVSQAGLALSPVAFLVACATLGASAALLLSPIVHSAILPLCFALFAYLPFHWAAGRIETRASDFAADFPSVLMATASSIQVGLTPLLALERATKLLPVTNPVHTQIARLLDALRRGIPRQTAMAHFATDIALPELELFRCAFSLVLDNGGRFAPTLQRLAQVSADRAMLIKSARVSTANMRMTANVLLAITPFVICTIAARTTDYWHTLFTHPTANFLASIGGGIITTGYVILRRMSAFKP